MLLNNKLKTTVFLLLILAFISSCQNQKFELKEGDVLFQNLDKDSIDNAIEKVTKTKLNYNFTHVGIVVKDNHQLKVLEAISDGVQLNSISDFLNRNLKNGKPTVVVATLNSEFKPLIKAAISHGKTLIGSPYDSIYIIGDNSYYCSELLYEMFYKANPNKKTFQLNPMTFKDPKNNKTLEFWKNYYLKLNHKIPEGEPGLNPNGMSVSPNITLIYDYFTGKKLN